VGAGRWHTTRAGPKVACDDLPLCPCGGGVNQQLGQLAADLVHLSQRSEIFGLSWQQGPSFAGGGARLALKRGPRAFEISRDWAPALNRHGPKAWHDPVSYDREEKTPIRSTQIRRSVPPGQLRFHWGSSGQ